MRGYKDCILVSVIRSVNPRIACQVPNVLKGNQSAKNTTYAAKNGTSLLSVRCSKRRSLLGRANIVNNAVTIIMPAAILASNGNECGRSIPTPMKNQIPDIKDAYTTL